jgi:hypothetical protein
MPVIYNMGNKRYEIEFKAVQQFTIHVDAPSLDDAIDKWLDAVQNKGWDKLSNVYEQTDLEAVTNDEPMIDIIMP